MPNVVLISNLRPELVRVILRYTPPGFETSSISAKASEEEKIALTQDADYLMLVGVGVSEKVLRASPGIKHIQLLSAGYDRMDFKLLDELGITASNNGGANSWAVSETTVGMIITLLHRHFQVNEFMRDGKWRGNVDGYDSYEVAEKTVGIVGLGNIGKKVAKRLKAFEVKLLYADPIPDPELEAELDMKRLPLHELLPQVDIVTLHVPLLETTRNLIDGETLGLLKPSSWLVNTCRGGVVDEPALLEALEGGRLRGAALDVFDQEPIDPDNPFLKMDNVVLGAHTAGQTLESYHRRAEFGFANLVGIEEGKPPMAIVREGDGG